MALRLLNLGTLVPETPCYVFMQQGIKFTVGLVKMTWLLPAF